MPLESSITKSIQKLAKSHGWWVMKIAGGPFQRAGVPDLLLVKGGRAVFLEVKQPGKKPTPLQTQVMLEIERVGGAVTAVVTSKSEAGLILEKVDGKHYVEQGAAEAIQMGVANRQKRRNVQEGSRQEVLK